MLKSLVLLAAQRLVASLAPGDCAFVGIYGEQDDFAVVLLEDADGDSLFVSDELPSKPQLAVRRSFAAKAHVRDAQRGSVLKRTDFEAEASSLVAPIALTVFKGSASDATALCSINLAKSGTAVRQLNEINLVTLREETAEYAGATSGSKMKLLQDIVDPENWQQGNLLGRQLFSIASGNATTTMTVTTEPMTTGTMTETHTMTTTNATNSDFTEASNVMGTSAACAVLLALHNML